MLAPSKLLPKAMKHQHSNRILGRVAHHRKALLQNLASSLLKHGFVVTTDAKAKELRRHFEPLVTLAKQELTLHRRRQLLQQLLHADDLPALLEVASVHAQRPGGYLRLTKLPSKRHDAAARIRVDIIREKTA